MDSITGEATSISVNDRANCLQRGRVGIRSHSSGGAWKNFTVKRVDAADLSPAAEKPEKTAVEHIARMPYAIDEPVLNGPKAATQRSRICQAIALPVFSGRDRRKFETGPQAGAGRRRCVAQSY